MSTIYKDVLAQSSDGALHEETFGYYSDPERNLETTIRENNFVQGMTVRRATFSNTRTDHLEVKLKNCIAVLKDYSPRAEKHIRNIEDKKVREESRKAYADQVVSMMQQIGRITMTLIRAEREVEDELAILCSNFYVGERRIENE